MMLQSSVVPIHCFIAMNGNHRTMNVNHRTMKILQLENFTLWTVMLQSSVVPIHCFVYSSFFDGYCSIVQGLLFGGTGFALWWFPFIAS